MGTSFSRLSATYPFVDIFIHKMNQFTFFPPSALHRVRDGYDGFIDLDAKVLKCNQLARHHHRSSGSLSDRKFPFCRRI